MIRTVFLMRSLVILIEPVCLPCRQLKIDPLVTRGVEAAVTFLVRKIRTTEDDLKALIKQGERKGQERAEPQMSYSNTHSAVPGSEINLNKGNHAFARLFVFPRCERALMSCTEMESLSHCQKCGKGSRALQVP